MATAIGCAEGNLGRVLTLPGLYSFGRARRVVVGFEHF